MPVVVATVTNGAIQYWPQFLAGLLGITTGSSTSSNWNPIFRSFKIGRGGWQNPGPIPRTPDPSLTDLDIITDFSRSTPQQRYPLIVQSPYVQGNIFYHEQTLTTGDYTFTLPGTLTINCTLDFGTFNDVQGVPSTPPGGPTLSPLGTNPSLWEMGVFSDMPGSPGNKLMVLYGTFSGEIKTNVLQLQNEFQLILAT